jgi:hypothetical protein
MLDLLRTAPNSASIVIFVRRLRIEMAQQIASEPPGSRAALALLDPPNTGAAPVPFELQPLSRLGERE